MTEITLDTPLKKVFVKSYGCQMNVYDSQRMSDILAKDGYESISSPEDADLILLNTCHIREKASEKVYSELGRMNVIKQNGLKIGREVKIGVAGCVAQAEGKEILARSKAVDLVVGPQSYQHLPTLLKSKKREVLTEFPIEDKFDMLPSPQKNRGYSAFVTVQEGCDKFCAFCVVPFTRGAEVSRPVEKIVREIEDLVAGGVKEFSLLGQNVNAYHGDNVTLAGLLARLSEIKGVERLRYTTSHPNDMQQDLIEAHRDNPKLMPYLHLPVQAGSDAILKAMNRKHTRDDYLRIIDRVRNTHPDMAFSSDFIVGFPNETDQDFEDTLDLVRQVGYSQCYSFKYSIRPGTSAAGLDNQVPKAVKEARLAELQALLNKQSDDFTDSLTGRTVSVLFEKKGTFEGQLVGKTPYLTPIHVDAPLALLGEIRQVKLLERGHFSHKGIIA